MKIPFYLTVSAGGTVKTTKSAPNLSWDEISIRINLELPNAIFQKPTLSAEIKIPNEAAVPHEITAEVSENIREAIQQHTGLQVKITVDNQQPQ